MAAVAMSLAVAIGIMASPALAAGGATIANAPVVVAGTQYFGALSDNWGSCTSDCFADDWWKVPVLAGDHVVMDWQASKGGECYNSSFAPACGYVLPVNTTDYNADQMEAIRYLDDSVSGYNQTSWTATKTGDQPIDFTVSPYTFDQRTFGCDTSCDFNFNFTVTIHHQAVLSLGPLTTAEHATNKVGVHYTDGSPVTGGATVEIEGKAGHSWLILGKASVSNGQALVHYTIPAQLRHRKVRFRAYMPASTTFLSATSATHTATVH